MTNKTKRSVKWIPTIKKSQYAGIHLIADFWYGRIIEDPKELKKILLRAAKEAKNTPLELVIHQFSPQGITGVVLLAESHIAVHSWPELNYLGIDIFTCGSKTFPYKAFNYFKKIYQPKKVKVREIKRG